MHASPVGQLKNGCREPQVSVLLAIKNKRGVLPNVLFSIAQQKTSFPWEVCIINDDPQDNIEPLVRQFLAREKISSNLVRVVYGTMSSSSGFNFAPAACVKLMAPSSLVGIIMSADCILLNDDVIESLWERVESKKMVLAEVADLSLPVNLYQNFDVEVGKLLSQWQVFLTEDRVQVARNRPHIWLLFVGAMMKEDMLQLDYVKNCCDAVLWQRMKAPASGYTAEILTYAKAVHQIHRHVPYFCPLVKSCTYHCCRTFETKRIVSPKYLYTNLARIIFSKREPVWLPPSSRFKVQTSMREDAASFSERERV
jgi:glycosyltransferase involved in cell wall biosynthesis